MRDWHLSVLAPRSADTEPTVVVAFDSAKYLFNAPENTQRAFSQNWRGRKRMRALFLSSVGTARASGLSGLLMGLADSDTKAINIVGPEGILHWLAASRIYTSRVGMAVKADEIAPFSSTPHSTPVYKDENIAVYTVPVLPDTSPLSESVSPGSKRKRSPSPSLDHPSKRPTLEGSTAHSPIDWPSRVRSPGFSSSALHGAEAQAWRRWTVESMFLLKPRAWVKGERPPPSAAGWLQQLPPFSHTRSPAPTEPQAPTPPPDYTTTPTLAYVVEGPKVRGKFDVAKAKALGLPKGPLWGMLSSGKTVKVAVDDGSGTGATVEKVVNPEDCLGPSEIPSVVLVFDVPTPAYIPSLLASFTTKPFFARFRSKKADDARMYTVHAAFHICGEGVLEDPRYHAFMNGFADHVHHIVSSREYAADPITFTSAAFAQLKMSALDADMFPAPRHTTAPPKNIKDTPGLPERTTPWRHHTFIPVRPPGPPQADAWGIEMDRFHAVAAADPATYIPALTQRKFADARALVRAQMDMVSLGEGGQAEGGRGGRAAQRPGDDVLVLPLGTVSSTPALYRSVSAILVRIPTWGSILLDAGEGAYGQLARLFGPDGVVDVLRDLRCVFVSHQHGDHQSGLAKLLAMRRTLVADPETPLYVVTNYHVHLSLRELHDVDDLGLGEGTRNGVRVVMSEALRWNRTASAREDAPAWTRAELSLEEARGMCDALGLESFETVDVKHRCIAFGAVIKHKDGWSVVYSGDTQPCEQLAQAGRGATLLIHEATMADDQAVMAKKKGHSTIGQAIDIGRSMRARNVLLTHFSARYPKVPPSAIGSVADLDGNAMTVALAFDQSCLRIGDMWKMAHYLPAIEQSFHLDTAVEDGSAGSVGEEDTQKSVAVEKGIDPTV